MAYRSSSYARQAIIIIMVALLFVSSLPLERVNADLCTASGLAMGLDKCLATSADKDDCCDYMINDIVVPCGITEICGLELGSDVLDFFGYCRFKCHGLPQLSTDF